MKSYIIVDAGDTDRLVALHAGAAEWLGGTWCALQAESPEAAAKAAPKPNSGHLFVMETEKMLWLVQSETWIRNPAIGE